MTIRDADETLAVVVPSAGLSARMGRSKALLAPGGIPFLERVVAANRQAGCGVVVVAVRSPGDAVAALARTLGAVVAVSKDPEQGPIESLRAGLRVLPEDVDRCLLHPVDHPLVSSGTIASLAEHAARDVRASIVLPLFDGRPGHPVLFRREVFPELLDPSLSGGARSAVRRDPGRVQVVHVEDEGVSANLDTPDDLSRSFPGFAP